MLGRAPPDRGSLISLIQLFLRSFSASASSPLPPIPSSSSLSHSTLSLALPRERESATPSRRGPPIPLRARASFQLFAFPGRPLESPLLYALSTWKLRRFPAICDPTPHSAARRGSLTLRWARRTCFTSQAFFLLDFLSGNKFFFSSVFDIFS